MQTKCCVSVCVRGGPGIPRGRLPVPLHRGLLRPRRPRQLDGAAGEQRVATRATRVRPLSRGVSAVQGRPVRGGAAAHPQGRPARHAGRLHGDHRRRRCRALQEQEEKGKSSISSFSVKFSFFFFTFLANFIKYVDHVGDYFTWHFHALCSGE